MVNAETKNKLIKEFQTGSHDTGSIEVQIALLTERINQLNKHFGQFPKDYASRVGLMKLVGRRRRFLKYIEQKDKNLYQSIIGRLGLRG